MSVNNRLGNKNFLPVENHGEKFFPTQSILENSWENKFFHLLFIDIISSTHTVEKMVQAVGERFNCMCVVIVDDSVSNRFSYL